MAAALQSSAGLVLRRAAAPASSSRLSSAGRTASAHTTARAMHQDYSGGSSDKVDGYFMAAAAFGTFLFMELMDGEFFWWGRESTSSSRPPRMTGRRRR